MKSSLTGLKALIGGVLMTVALTLSASPLERMDMVGEAELNWFFLSIYKAKLYTPDGEYQPRRYPQALEIEYFQDIDKTDLVEATLEQWQHLGLYRSEQQLWLEQLQQIWPDIKQGDKLTFIVEADGSNRFLFNNNDIGGVDSSKFSDSFLAIWLSERSSRPKLRDRLVGDR